MVLAYVLSNELCLSLSLGLSLGLHGIPTKSVKYWELGIFKFLREMSISYFRMERDLESILGAMPKPQIHDCQFFCFTVTA